MAPPPTAGGTGSGPTTGGGGGGGGIPVDMRRRETSKNLLTIEWTHPVYAPDLGRKVEAGRTSTGTSFVTLPKEQALLEISDDSDHRPLLVLRECDTCKGSDAALLSRKLDNEKTVLMTRWFRCVKLPNDVLAENHPFKALFGDKHPPHLFMCDKDGENYVPLDGNQSQTLLWKVMTKTLKRRYEKDPAKALKKIRRILNEYDMIDVRENDILARIDDELVKRGAKSPQSKKLQKKLAAVRKDREETLAREKNLFDLKLIAPNPETAEKADDI